jgi:hypothetical protein
MKAEAYLLSAEVDVMLSELDAAVGAPNTDTQRDGSPKVDEDPGI